ncbi:MAG: TIGR04076 family protein [Clostridia bacterium]|nr:TIGR04076 family protein [Clostridia bacterium]
MSKVAITVLRRVCHDDLIARYENPMENACDMREGMRFVTDGYRKPDGLCDSAWLSIAPFAMALAAGAENLYDGWMKDPKTAMVSCNDGFRSVSFLLEAIDG